MPNPFDRFDQGNPFDRFESPEPQPAPKITPPRPFIGTDIAEKIGDITQGGKYLPWSTVMGQAVENAPASAKQFGLDIVQPVIHPMDTAKSIGKLLLGTIQKAIPGEQSSEKYADAVGRFFVDRYGGMEELKKTIANDPVGFTADAASILTAGGAALAKAPATAGKIGQTIQKVGRAIDPVNAAAKGAKLAGRAAGEITAGLTGLTTGSGRQSIKTAARAGMKGGDAASDFQRSLRGGVAMEDIVDDARAAVRNMRQERGRIYRADMAKIAGDKTVLDFDDIDRAVTKAAQVKRYKGVPISDKTAGISQEIIDKIEDWKNLDPTEFHTPEGLDALKQSIGDIRDSTQFGTPARKVANDAYRAIKDRIVAQAPEYGKYMKDYERASGLIREMETTLSLNPKASIDTSLRKLQSVMRNNANTNYGRRVDLAEMLQDAGAANLMEKLAGQQLTSFTPRGLAKFNPTATGLAALANPYALAMLPFESPRLVGEGAYYAGKGAGVASDIYGAVPQGTGLAGFQAGRISSEDRQREMMARALEVNRVPRVSVDIRKVMGR